MKRNQIETRLRSEKCASAKMKLEIFLNLLACLRTILCQYTNVYNYKTIKINRIAPMPYSPTLMITYDEGASIITLIFIFFSEK